MKKKGIGEDFSDGGSPAIDYVHRTTGSGEIYFLRNGSEESAKSFCEFLGQERRPELWDASDGSVTPVEDYTMARGKTGIEIDLPPHGSVFVVFRESRGQLPASAPRASSARAETEVRGPWLVRFPEKWGAPPVATFTKLISWTDSKDSGIKFFSGTATYENSFALEDDPAGKKVRIDLGEIRDVAEVYVNGKSAGVLWKKPYSADISTLVKSGKNELKVEVVNMWANRLTGDMLAAPQDRYCRTNHRYMKSEVWPGGDETYTIQTSGLLGPVSIVKEGAIEPAPNGGGLLR